MSYIPPDNLAYPLLLELVGSTGSGFFLSKADEVLLVTAKHVLYDERGGLRSPSLKLSCPPKNADEHSTQYQIDLNLAVILRHEVADVAIVKMGKRIRLEDLKSYQMVNGAGVTTLRAAPSGTVSVDSEIAVRRQGEVTIGNDVLLYGYPTSLGLKQTPQFDYDKPLLRKGVLAGRSLALGTLVLDCPAYPGNSGGPVVEVEDEGARKVHRVIGVVSHFVPQVLQRYSPHTGRPIDPELANSGYSIAVAIDRVFELLNGAS